MAGKFDGKQSVKSSTTVSNNLTELDNLLAELGSSPFVVDAADRPPDSRMITMSFYLYFTVWCCVISITFLTQIPVILTPH